MILTSVILKIIGKYKIKDERNCTLDKLSPPCPRQGTQLHSSEITLHPSWNWMVINEKQVLNFGAKDYMEAKGEAQKELYVNALEL